MDELDRLLWDFGSAAQKAYIAPVSQAMTAYATLEDAEQALREYIRKLQREIEQLKGDPNRNLRRELELAVERLTQDINRIEARSVQLTPENPLWSPQLKS